MTSGISKLKIGPRLILGFALIILLMLAGNTLLVWQFHAVNEHSDRVSALAQELVAVSRFQTDLLSLDAKLDSLAKSEDIEGLRQETTRSRPVLVTDIEAIRNALVHLPSDLGDSTPTQPIVESVGTTLSSQLDAVVNLGGASDWNAVRLRLANEKKPLETRASDLVRSVQQQVSLELVQSVTQSERLKSRILLILPLTAFLTLLFATLLGAAITRSITVPLRQLLQGSTALAGGDFDYQVQLRGKDELAHVSAVFNQASIKLGELYRKLEEAQRIAHVGYWERDLATDRITWSDETYRVFGLQPQECPIEFDTFRQKVHPEDWEFVSRAVNAALAGGPRYNLEYRVLQPAGELRIVHSEGDVKRDASGRLYKMFGVIQDITGRKQAEEALKRSEFYLREGERLAHMGSWAFNPSGFFDYWSRELFQIYGLDPMQGTPNLERYLATLHPQDRESMAETIKTMIAERCGCDVTKRIVRPDGEQRYIRCVGIPVVDGEVLKGFLGTAMDVTEQELLTQELERRQAYLAEAQKLSHTGSWAWSPTGGNKYYSEECFRVLGFEPQGVPPALETVIQRIHPDDQAYCREQVERAIREKVASEFDYRIVHPDKRVRDIHCVGHPVLDGSGNLVELVGTVIDVTERKRADEERQAAEQERERLHQLEAELAHINRVSTLGEMAASLAHEIKQPIAAAITSANSCIEWLSHDPPNIERARTAATRIDRYGKRAAEIIDRIRSFYKKSHSERELVDVNGIINEMLALFQGEATRYSVEMRSELTTELPKIRADRVQLQQVFMNLMLNAVEAMNASGGEVTVRSQLQEGQLLFSVSDTGPGLPVESAEQIFSAFFTTKPQGSGMGLAISRSIVESHGGRLWATANDGRGATFHFTLPTEVP
jgi:PAS domain S-box-containing protein